jgi:hypothetical protein
MMSKPELPHWHVELLAESYSLAVSLGHHNDARAILDVLAKIGPDAQPILLAQSIDFFQQRDFSSSRALLERADAAEPGSALVKALLAWTLYMQRDGLWVLYATESRALSPQSTATMLNDALDRATGSFLNSADGTAQQSTVPGLPMVPGMGLV